MSRLIVPVVTVAAAAALAVCVALDGIALIAAIALYVALFAYSWPVLTRVEQTRWGSSLVVLISGLAALAVSWWFAEAKDPLEPMPGLLAASVALAFVQQMVRRDRTGVVTSLTNTLTGQVIVVLGAGWVLLPHTALGPRSGVVAVIAIVVAVLMVASPLDPTVRGWAAFGAAALVSGIAAAVLADGSVAQTAFVGVAVAAVAAGTAVLFQSRPVAVAAVPAAALGPIFAAGTLAYGVARLAGA